MTILGDPNPVDPYPVRNANGFKIPIFITPLSYFLWSPFLGASVGRVVGDGISLIHTNETLSNWDYEVLAGKSFRPLDAINLITVVVGLVLYIDMETLALSDIPPEYVFDFGVEV